MAGIELKNLKHAGVFAVTVYGREQYIAPYSKKQCLWYDWLYRVDRQMRSGGYTHSPSARKDSLLTIETDKGTIEISSTALNPYLSPSFTGQDVIDGEEVHIEEYCIEADRTYFAGVTSFRAHLPPRWFIPHVQKIYLLNLYDEPPVDGKPVSPLIPTCSVRTG